MIPFLLLFFLPWLTGGLLTAAERPVLIQGDKNKGYKGLTVIVVYHAYANRDYKHWPVLLHNQLRAIKASGLFDVVNKFYVALTTGATKDERLWRKATEVIRNVTDVAIVNATYGGYFEYDGIYKAWNASVQSTDKQNTIVSYFHSKGGFNHGDGTLIDGRTRSNVFLNKVVMEDWRFILDHFVENKDLLTAGLAATCSSPAQFHNFWWARASYVSGRPEPQFGNNIERHYYEFWLGEGNTVRRPNDTMSVCDARYHILPQPGPPDCDKHVKDSQHPKDTGAANNMYYALYCEEKISPLLGIRIPHLEAQH